MKIKSAQLNNWAPIYFLRFTRFRSSITLSDSSGIISAFYSTHGEYLIFLSIIYTAFVKLSNKPTQFIKITGRISDPSVVAFDLIG